MRKRHPKKTTGGRLGPLIQPQKPTRRALPIGEALRLIRTRQGLTQTAAGKLDGAADFRTLSHWETRRKTPSLKLLYSYLGALGLDFGDLQAVLDHLDGIGPPHQRLELLAEQVNLLGRRLERLEQLTGPSH